MKQLVKLKFMIEIDMNTDKTAFSFYLTLIFVYFSDMVLLISTILISFKITQSPIFLGLTMSCSVVIPFIIKKYFSKFDILRLPLIKLYFFRMLIYFIILLTTFIFGFNYITIIILSIFIGLLNLSTLSTYETSNTQLVLLGSISSDKAARIMQTVIQVGSFSGAAVAGFLLNKVDVKYIFIIISIVDIVASIFFITLFNKKFKILSSTVINHINNLGENSYGFIKKGFYLLLTIGLIGSHISLFNFITPILLAEVKFWNESIFGYVSASAGLGAFIASFLKQKTVILLIFPILLAISDFIYGFSTSILLSIFVCFIIGFLINSIRIKSRELLINITNSSLEAKILGEKSALYYFLFQSASPVLIGAFISIFKNSVFKSSILSIVALIITLILSLALLKFQNRKIT